MRRGSFDFKLGVYFSQEGIPELSLVAVFTAPFGVESVT